MKNTDYNMFLYNNKGFTIVEVMIAIAILTIGLLSVASMQIGAIKGNHFSDNTTCALTLAEDKMEELLSLDYNNLELNDVLSANNNDLFRIDVGWFDKDEMNIDETGKINAGHFRRIWNIADNKPIDGNKLITVIVTWDNDAHEVSLTSIKRK